MIPAGNAKIAGLDKDLGMTGYDYNITLSAFYVSYILFGIPAVMVCKWVGPGWFLPTTSIMFGVCSVATAFVTSVPQACGIRFLLGIFETGMMPGIAYYLSRWYKRAELTFRLSLYIMMAPLAGAFGGLLAGGILRLPRIGSLTSWRMIFALEGILTIGLSILALVVLTDRPETAIWLGPEEKALVIARVRSERVLGDEVVDAMGRRKFLRGVFSPVTLSVGFIFLLDAVMVQTFAFFLPSIIRTIFPDYTTIQQQLLTAPPYLAGAAMMVSMSALSWRFDRRQVFFKPSTVLVIIAYIVFLTSNDQWARYAATFLASTVFTLGPLTNAQVAANVVSDTARSAAIATNCMLAHCGGLIGSWTFVEWDAPRYRIGNGLNLGAATGVLVLSTLTLLWMKADNKARDEKAIEVDGVDESLSGLTEKELDNLDWQHPSFRWKP